MRRRMGRNVKVAAVQAHPKWLDPAASTLRVLDFMHKSAAEGATLVIFPESFLPGYPFWVMMGETGTFTSRLHQAAYGAYLDAAVRAGGKEIRDITAAAGDLGLFVYLGVAERVGTSIYASLVAISPRDGVVGVHRKLVPTYAERLVWAPGDGHGLRTHEIGALRVGGLNCWENWMPQARHALYAEGEDLHVSVFPGSSFATGDLARFIALEGRVWVVLASGLLDAADVPDDFPFRDALVEKPPGFYDGGSCIVAPDGTWVVEPIVDREHLLIGELDLEALRRARMSFDPAGHYSRPDVFDVRVDRRRRRACQFED